MNTPVVSRALVALLLMTTFVGLRPGSAAACSCATPDPIDAIETSDIVFTGSKAGGAEQGGWRFEVDGVVKGDVGAFVEILDRGASQCDVSYDDAEGEIVIFANERDDEIVAFGCVPVLPAAAFESLSTEFVDPAGAGPPAALAVGRRGFADLRVLDAQGRLLGAADLDGNPFAAAHCPGTSLVAVVSSDVPGGISYLSVVDIESMEVVARLDAAVAEPFELGIHQGDIACLDGGDRVVIATGPSGGVDDRSVRLQSIDMMVTSAGVTDTVSGRGQGIIHPSGTVLLFPTSGDGQLRTAAPGTAREVDPPLIELGDGVSAKSGAVNAAGDQLALLVTLEGEGIDPYAVVSSHVMVLDVLDGVPVPGSQRLVELPGASISPEFGQPEEIIWLDEDTWVVERRTGRGHWIDLIGTDGAPISSSLHDRGWGLVALEGSVLRSPHAGLELVGRDGSSTGLEPAPVDVSPESPFFLAPIVDGADLDVHLVPDIEPIIVRSLEDAPAIEESSEIESEADSTAVEPTVGDDQSVSPDDSGTAQDDQAASSDEGRSTNGLIVGIVMLGVFVVGLRAIKRQRDEGRRSKLPPIG